MNKHKKKARAPLSTINPKALENPHTNNRTTARACTI